MPNRTIYLPDELDETSRRLKLNLSRVVQDAIRELASTQDADSLNADVEAASSRAEALAIDWSDFSLESTRSSARER